MDKAKNLSVFGRLFLTVVLMLLASLSALADGVSKTVNLTSEGTLPDNISSGEKNTITNLTVTGPVDATDINYIVDMVRDGELVVVDLSGATTNNTDLVSDGMFKETALKNISLPSGITLIGNNAFQNCTSLTCIVIPDGVTKIESFAFSGCTSLTDVTIPEGVETIGNYAFEGCTELMNITIPSSVTSILSRAFRYCI